MDKIISVIVYNPKTNVFIERKCILKLIKINILRKHREDIGLQNTGNELIADVMTLNVSEFTIY